MAEVKPRFDGKEPDGFANLHRLLGNKELMFDVDRVYADINIGVSMRHEDNLFCEYNFVQQKVVFKAIFELKYHKTNSALDALDSKKANSIARLEMARLLNCRLFVVFQTNGKQPFEFWEINKLNGEAEKIGILSYTNKGDAKTAFRFFWDNVLKI